MTSELPTLGGFPKQSEVRIVLLGDTGADQAKVAESICPKSVTVQKYGPCHLHRAEEGSRKISVVETPGWNRSSNQQTAPLCPPGPLLLVLPVKDLSKGSSTNEIADAQSHVELLSERVSKYTYVSFDFYEWVADSARHEHICRAEKILGKCGRRFHVLRRNASEISDLFKKIEHLVEDNKYLFIPQHVYEGIQRQTEAIVESAIRQRRGSLVKDRPNFGKEEEDSDDKKETVEIAKPLFLALDRRLEPFSVIQMAIIGALIGSVAGAGYGAPGACVGLVLGFIVGVLLTIFVYNLINSRFNSNKPTNTSA